MDEATETTTEPTPEQTLNDLIALGEQGRVERAEKRPCHTVEWDGVSFKASVQGADGYVWQPRIHVSGVRSYDCNCFDRRKRGGTMGPCKHVLSLAAAGLEELSVLESLNTMFN
jgi:hypothetical protein